MITFDDMWHFLETTFCDEKVLDVIDNEGRKLDHDYFICYGKVEKKFDLEILRDLWKQKHTFILQSSSITRELANLVEEIEEDNKVDAGAHVYAGLMGSRSFKPHQDKPDNLIIQCIGESRVTLYNEEKEIDLQKILKPGQSIYIPSKQFHLFEPLSDRLSISIPMYPNDYQSE